MDLFNQLLSVKPLTVILTDGSLKLPAYIVNEFQDTPLIRIGMRDEVIKIDFDLDTFKKRIFSVHYDNLFSSKTDKMLRLDDMWFGGKRIQELRYEISSKLSIDKYSLTEDHLRVYSIVYATLNDPSLNKLYAEMFPYSLGLTDDKSVEDKVHLRDVTRIIKTDDKNVEILSLSDILSKRFKTRLTKDKWMSLSFEIRSAVRKTRYVHQIYPIGRNHPLNAYEKSDFDVICHAIKKFIENSL